MTKINKRRGLTGEEKFNGELGNKYFYEYGARGFLFLKNFDFLPFMRTADDNIGNHNPAGAIDILLVALLALVGGG